MRFGLAVAVLMLMGCSTGFSEFYNDYSEGVPREILVGEPSMYGGSKNFEDDILGMYEAGYFLIGESSFNGALEDEEGAKEQAQKVGAHAVLLYSEFTDSRSGVIPFTSTRPVTTFHSGTVSAGGVGGAYAGTSTTYVPQTTFIPYNVRRYDQMALYFVKMPPACLGALMYDATNEEKRAAGSHRINKIVAIRKGSPAYDANLFPGDLLVAVNDGAVNVESSNYGRSGETIKLKLLRPIAQSTSYSPVSVELKLGVCE